MLFLVISDEIANPSPGHTNLREHRGEFFEMLGPVKTSQYSEVNWASGTTSLPEDIVQRFDGKVIAITGYEGVAQTLFAVTSFFE